MSIKANVSEFIYRVKSEAQRVSMCRQLPTMQRCICESGLGRMLCHEGETLPQSSIIKTGDFPRHVKRKLCAVLKAVQRWPFCVKASFTVRFLVENYRGGTICVSGSQCVYWLAAPQFATPSMCVSGVEVPQEWEYLSTLRAGKLAQSIKNVFLKVYLQHY